MQKQIGFRKINTDAPHKDNSEHKEFLQSYRFLCIILIDSQDATNQNGDLNQTQPIKEISTAPGPQLPQDGLYRRQILFRSKATEIQRVGSKKRCRKNRKTNIFGFNRRNHLTEVDHPTG